ncbi:MAG: hypothetical protein IH956_01530 [Chloroflexi bacterium]|nr:hypothetical protein [Chloroflexota bacterium]
MFTLATDYFLLVFIASLGVIQIAASSGGLNGLLIFKSPIVARALGLALAVAAFILFFSTDERNLNDYEGGLDANTQALFFFLGVLAGGWVTFIGSSLVNIRMKGKDPSPDGGFDALRETNYLRALALSLGYWSRNWRQQMKSYFSG